MITGTADKAFVAGMTDALLVGALVMVAAALATLALLPARIRPADEQAPPSGG